MYGSVHEPAANDGSAAVSRGSSAAARNWAVPAVVGLLTIGTVGVGGRVFVGLTRDEPATFDTTSGKSRGSQFETAASAPAELTVANEYGVASGWHYPFLTELGNALIEPYRTSSVLLRNAPAGSQCDWEIGGSHYGSTSPDVSRGGNHEMIISLNKTGEHALVTRCTTNTAGEETVGETQLRTGQLWCKYVRREMRELNAKDRLAFFSAAATLWHVTTVDGRSDARGFGSAYYDITALTLIHNDLAGNVYCDYLHAGLNFLGGHIAFGNMFERSVQGVDPTVALPYWDYNDDYANFGLTHAGDENIPGVWNSTAWGPGFFGSSDPVSGRIVDGAWAGATVPTLSADVLEAAGVSGWWASHSYASCDGVNKEVCASNGAEGEAESDLEHTSNAYGQLRSPWNLNGAPYVTRSHDNCGAQADQFPSCTAVSDMQADYDSFSDYVWDLMYSPHGSVHNFVGGAFGSCKEGFDKLRQVVGVDLAEELQYKNNDMLKYLYQASTKSWCNLTWPSAAECMEGGPNTECKMQCGGFNETWGLLLEMTETWTERRRLGAATSDPNEPDGVMTPAPTVFGAFAPVPTARITPVPTARITAAPSARITTAPTAPITPSPTVALDDEGLRSGSSYAEMLRNLTLEQQHFVVGTLCNTSTMVGDMLNSGSPLDISFWLTHPSVERMWQRKALSGTFTDMTWPTADCDCAGHHPAYVMRWHDYTFDEAVAMPTSHVDDGFGDDERLANGMRLVSGNLTNEQYRDLINPAGSDYARAIPYVYNHFNWSACAKTIFSDNDHDIYIPDDLMWDSPWIAG
jgi:hypothetical protein